MRRSVHLAMARAGGDEERRMAMAKNAKSHTARTMRMAFAREAKFGLDSLYTVFGTAAPLRRAHFIALLAGGPDAGSGTAVPRPNGNGTEQLHIWLGLIR